MSVRIALVVAALALGAGCLQASEAGADFGDDDAQGLGQCVRDADCTLAGPSCCECPTFAVASASGWADACEQVECPLPADCPALEARCADDGMCVAACAAVACDLACADGFAIDAAGCTLCACANGPAAPACLVDGDCARVPADCCGCDRGGRDVAVPASEAGAFVEALGCTGAEACPGVSTCDPAAVVRCSGGRCELGSGGLVPPPTDGVCGRPEQPPCPEGLVCVINSAGGEAGEGRCAAP